MEEPVQDFICTTALAQSQKEVWFRSKTKWATLYTGIASPWSCNYIINIQSILWVHSNT